MADTSRGPKVLIVDDEAGVRSFLSDLLGSAGYDVVEAADGAEVASVLQAYEIGVAIVDKNLPGGRSGLDLLGPILTKNANTRVIIHTAYPSKESVIQALKAGAFDYLEKPTDLDLILAQVGRAQQTYELAAARDDLFRRYEALFETVPGIVWFMSEDGVFKRINREGAALLGYDPEDLMEQPYNVLLDNDSAQSDIWAFKERRTGLRATRRQVLELRTRSGERRVFEISATGAYDRTTEEPNRRFKGTLGAGWDITDHVSLRRQLDQARKLEAIGRLAGGIAHDFNNLLSAILSNAELIRAELDPSSTCWQDLGDIELAARRGAELTRKLLTFSRRQAADPQPIRLNDVIDSMKLMLRRLISEQIELEMDLGEHLPRISADAGQIEQVILNLAINARDAMLAGGRLFIQTREVIADEATAYRYAGMTPGSWVSLTVRDTGVGMTRDVREHLFEPFFTTKPIGCGTGLGMATVYGILSRSGGVIDVRSESGEGTTVQIFLPAVSGPLDSEMGEHAQGKVTAGGEETILLVEDDDIVRRSAQRLLRRAGYRVLEAAEPGVALQRATQEPIDIVVTDVVMPVMSGPELVEKLRTTHEELLVVYLSGYVGSNGAGEPLTNRATEFLQKPFTSAALLDKVRRLLDARADVPLGS